MKTLRESWALDEPVAGGARARVRWWRWLLVAGGLAAAAVTLQGHLPSPQDAWAALSKASPAWVLLAGGLSLLSMAAFAEQQRHLLSAFGVRMPARASLALSYARSAMAAALPAGSAISAGYAFRQFRARGAGPAAAGAVILLSGVASLAGLALVYMVIEVRWTLWLLAAVALPLARISRPAVNVDVPPRSGGRLRHVLRLAAAVPPRRWLGVLTIAACNWLTDLACLLAAVQAVGLHVPWEAAAVGYLVAQLVRQIPATPGGVGVIEATLVVALTTAGAATAPAAAAVLIYRVLSCWGIMPIGLACWSALRTRVAAPVSA